MDIKMDLKKRQESILNGNMYRTILALSFPIMINNLIQTLYNLVDGLWISKIGSVEFASTSFVWPINFLFISLGMGFAIAGTSILSQLLGAGEKEKANKYASQLIVLSIILGIVLTGIGLLLSKPIIRLMGVQDEILYFGDLYLKITLLDLPFMFLFSIFNAVMNSQGNTVLPTVLNAISAILSAILNPILMFTFNMGVAGAAVSTVVAKAILAITGLIILFKGNTAIKPNFKNFKFDKDIIVNSVKIALPASIGQSGSAMGFLVLNTFIVSYGTSTMAAYAMVNRVTSLVMQPAMGIGTSLVSIVGQNLGANNLARAKEGFSKSITVTSVIGVLGGILLVVFRDPIVNFFMQSKDDMKVIEQGITYMVIMSFSMPLMGIFSVLQGLFQGSGHTKYAMSMEIGRLWFVRLPMILLFKYFSSMNEIGIWLSMSSSNLIICIYGYLIYKRGRWMDRISR